MISFSKITEEDKNIYLKMVKNFYNSPAVLHNIDEENIINTFNQCLKSDIYTECFLIRKDNKVIGYTLISKTYSQEVGSMVLLIEEIYLLNDFRFKGIGTKIINFLKEEYKDFKRIRLEVSENNHIAKSLYKKLGFEVLTYTQMIIDR